MNLIVTGILVSLTFAGLIYIASQNIFTSLFLFLISILFFVFIVRRRIDKYQEKTRRYHQCYHFINNYLISLSIKGSLTAAMESCYNTANEATKEMISSIKELNEEEKLSYLMKYFRFDLYRLFLDIVSLWNEQGGDILSMSQYLMNQTRLKEEYILACQSAHRSKTLEFVALWAIALAILGSLRFALSQFYTYISKTIFYQIAVPSIFVFVLISIYILVNRITNIVLEGWKDEEK